MKQFLLIVSSLLAGAAGCYVLLHFSTIERLQEKAHEQDKQLQSLKQGADRVRLKETADSLFFAGNMEEAYRHYEQFDALYPSSQSIAQKRLNWLNGLDSVQATAIRERIQLQEELDQHQNEHARLSDALTSGKQEKERLHSNISLMQQQLQKQRDSLLKIIEKERKSVMGNHVIDTLSFQSSKQHLVRFYGQTTNKKANGIGSATWSTGGYYYGMWKNNLRNGKGIYYWKDGERYEGEFVNDKRQGLGKYFWNNGAKYEGSWNNDQRNGFGTLYDETGKVKFKGEWVNDTPKE